MHKNGLKKITKMYMFIVRNVGFELSCHGE